MKEWTIKQVSLTDVLPIRHTVLWPNDTIESCIVEGDDSALHFSTSINREHVCVASIYQDGKQRFRLRKFATLEEHQGKGIGTNILTFIIQELGKQGATELWCDARDTALPFYQRFGFERRGDRFNKRGIFYYKMHCDITKT